MILVSAPMRVSFFGGGSDIRAFYQNNGGAFLSMAINSRIYLAINKTTNNEVKIHYSKTEIVSSAEEIVHPLIKKALLYFDMPRNIEIGSFADLPTSGTGLGSSSSFSVALMGGLGQLKNQSYSAQELAELACHLEIDLCQEPIGKQDQYAASFGGFNFYTIDRYGVVTVSRNILEKEPMQAFEKCLYLVFTGVKRSASRILASQAKNIQTSTDANQNQQRVVSLAYEAHELLKNGDFYRFGELLDIGWQKKKTLSKGISNPDLDVLYDEGMEAGATGGKILGAGGGGYFLFFVPPENHSRFEDRFNDNIIRISTSKYGFQCHYET